MVDFMSVFDKAYLSKLGVRAPTFRAVVREALSLGVKSIVETGCTRAEDNWEGDGQSSVIWAAFAEYHGGTFTSIDIDQDALDLTMKLTKNVGRYFCGDSVLELQHQWKSAVVDLLYLDSFDLDMNNPHPAALHCLFEFLSARPRLKSNSIVFVDDSPFSNGTILGKGMYVAEYFKKLGVSPFAVGYQAAWILP
jgi:hypothetical protein